MAATLPQPPRLSRAAKRILHERREPGRVPAAVFAMLMHILFVAVLVFGVSWQVKSPAPVVAELWEALPTRELPPPPPPPPTPPVDVEPPPQPVEPPRPTRADIQEKAKKEKQEKLDKAKLEQQKRDEQKRLDEKKKAEEEKQRLAKQRAAEEKARAETEAREAAVRQARDVAIRDYTSRIAALIRNRAAIPDTVMGRPVIQVRLRLLVNGVVFDAQVVKPSGNRVYDESVERAINGIRQWPLPDDPSLLGGRRELILNIEHER